MKLTKTQKTNILRSAGKPIADAANALTKKAYTEWVDALYDYHVGNVETLLYEKYGKAGAEKLFPPIKGFRSKEEARFFYLTSDANRRENNMQYCSLNSSRPRLNLVDYLDESLEAGKASGRSAADHKRLLVMKARLFDEAKAAVEAAKVKLDALRSTIMSASTDKQLLEWLPELKGVIPAQSSCTALIAAETIATARKALNERESAK